MTVTENWDYGHLSKPIVIYELSTRKSQITTEKYTWKRKSDFNKITKMTVTDHNCFERWP
jgi:hypothetical protein